MKRLLLVISTLNNGGAQRIFSNIMMCLPEDYQIDIILNDTENITYPYRGNIIDLELKPTLDKTKLSYQFQVICKRLIKVFQYKKKYNYLACISALTSANFVNIITKRKSCKTILTEHNYMSIDKGKGIKSLIIFWVIRYFYNRADCIVAVSKGIERDLIQKFKIKKERVKTIYNGYVINEIKKQAEESLNNAEQDWFRKADRVIVTAGRISYQKGQWHLIKALKKVKLKVPDIKLLILGEGELEYILKKYAEECGLKENVVFCGFLKNPYKIIKHSNVFILPSLYEGFGNVIIESFCCGIPCISTDFKVGAREIMAPNTDIYQYNTRNIEKAKYGILCPVCDGIIHGPDKYLTYEENILADAIIEILESDDLRKYYCSMGYRRAENFNINKIINEWLEVIEYKT